MQRTYITQALTLDDEIIKARKNCWEAETKFREIETKIREIEAHCAEKFANTNPFLDYKLYKVAELKDRLKILNNNIKKLPAYAEQIDQLAKQLAKTETEYKKFQTDLDHRISALDDYTKATLCPKIIEVCKELESYPVPEKIKVIERLDGLVAMKAAQQVIEEMIKLNDADLFKEFKAATAKSISNVKTFEEIFKKATDKNIKEYFETFAAQPNATITQAKLDELADSMLSKFWSGLSKSPLKATDNTAYNRFVAHFRMALYLNCIRETYSFTCELKSAGAASQALGLFGGITSKFLSFSLDQAINPYKVIALSAKYITPVNPVAYKFLQQLLSLIRGMHYRCYNQMPDFLKVNGQFTEEAYKYSGDQDDRDFCKYKKAVKWHVAQYHLPHFQSLLGAIPEKDREKVLGSELCEIFNAKSPAAAVINKESSGSVVTLQRRSKDAEKKEVVASVDVVTQETPKSGLQKTPSRGSGLFPSHDEYQAGPNYIYKEDTVKFFKNTSDFIEDSAILCVLKSLLDTRELSEQQVDVLSPIRDALKNEMTGYIKSWKTTNGLPNLFGRTFAAELEEILTKFNDPVTSFQEQIKKYVEIALQIHKKSNTFVLRMMENIKAIVRILDINAEERPSKRRLPQQTQQAAVTNTPSLGISQN